MAKGACGYPAKLILSVAGGLNHIEVWSNVCSGALFILEEG